MNDRQRIAIESPCWTALQTFHDRYRRTFGDVHSILTIARYTDLNHDHPVWHASADLRAIDRVPRERATWKRRDVRAARLAVAKLLDGVGKVEEEWEDPPGQHTQYALHVLRPLTPEEFRALPAHYRTSTSAVI